MQRALKREFHTIKSRSTDLMGLGRNYLSDDQVKLFFPTMAANGIELVRTWAFLNGDRDPLTQGGTIAIQPKASRMRFTNATSTCMELFCM